MTTRRMTATSRATAALLMLLAASGITCTTTRVSDSTIAGANGAGADTQGGHHGMVASANTIASAVGAEVMRAGGNAVDAAIATGFALAVVHPSAGNIGGGGFMVIRLADGRATTIDFREKAPLTADPEMFLDANKKYSSEIHHRSHKAVGVPGTVAGFALAHSKYGKLPWPKLVEPAIRLAGDGVTLSPALARSIEGGLRSMQKYPASVKAFSHDGVAYKAGETWRQPDLARTLGRIRDEGRDGFYRGETARLLAEEMRRGGGLITEEDLARYQAKEREPVRGNYRGNELITMPPPSSGGVVLIEMLNILEGWDLRAVRRDSAAFAHRVIEAMRRAYRDRARFGGDPDFVQVPVARLTSKEYATKLRGTIDLDHATPSAKEDVAMAAESLETTHYSVIDGAGAAVAVTYTLEGGYGSKITVPGAGFLLNNEMGDFNAGPGLTDDSGLIGTDPNLARPEHRMLSSMTPTIVVRGGKLLAVVGSPGGRTIPNTVLSVVVSLIDFDMNIQQAVEAKRFHHQWLSDQTSMEEGLLSPEALRSLQAMGHKVSVRGRQGAAHSLMIDPRTGDVIGGADPRDSDGGARGY